MAEKSSEKKRRQPNFSANEKFELFSLISQKYRRIIENKLTDKVTMSEKDMAWRKIEKDFNAMSPSGLFRGKECLKRFYENRKREIRKLKAVQKQEMIKTGGGPKTKIIFDVADELLVEIMNVKTFEGLLNNYDSDEHTNMYGTTIENTGTKEIFNKYQNVSRVLEYEESMDNSNTFSIKRFKKAEDLRTPKDPTLRPLYLTNISKDKDPEGTNNNNIIVGYEEWIGENNFCLGVPKKYEDVVDSNLERKKPIDSVIELAPYNLKNPSNSNEANELEGVLNSIDNQKENKIGSDLVYPLNESRPGPRNKAKKPTPNKNIFKGKTISPRSRPHRSGIQILSTSHIAKKYDELLDQRKVLLDKQIEIASQDLAFQRAKHRLEIEILTMKLEKEKNTQIDGSFYST